VGLRRTNARLVNLYHRFLVWDLIKKPRLTRVVERILNPILGKSLVVYARKTVKPNRPKNSRLEAAPTGINPANSRGPDIPLRMPADCLRRLRSLGPNPASAPVRRAGQAL
jgi:hypothetical protein